VPDTRFFAAFGYAVLKDLKPGSPPTVGEKDEYFFIEFGREIIPVPGRH
jgi:hypothetical protein